MAEGLFSRFKPGEDRGMSDPTWGGGKLGAPSVTDFNPLVPLAGIPIGYGAYGGYKGAQALNLARKEALDLISKFDPGRRKVLKNIAGTVGKGLVDLSPVITWPLKDLQVPDVPSESVGTAVTTLSPYFKAILDQAERKSSVPIESDSPHYYKTEFSSRIMDPTRNSDILDVANRGMHDQYNRNIPMTDQNIVRQDYAERAYTEDEKQRHLNSGNLGRAAEEIDLLLTAGLNPLGVDFEDDGSRPLIQGGILGLPENVNKQAFELARNRKLIYSGEDKKITDTLRGLTRLATWFRNPDYDVIPVSYGRYAEGKHAPEFKLRDKDRVATGPLGGDTLTKFFNTVAYTGDQTTYATSDEYLTDNPTFHDIAARGTQPLDWEYRAKLGWRDHEADQANFLSDDRALTDGEVAFTQNRILGTGAKIYNQLLSANDALIAIEWLQENDPGKLLYIIDLALSEEVQTGYKSWKHPELLEPKDRTRGVHELGRAVLDRDVRDARLRPAREADSFTTGQLSRADLDKYNIYRRKLAPLISEKGFIDFLEDLEKETRKRM